VSWITFRSDASSLLEIFQKKIRECDLRHIGWSSRGLASTQSPKELDRARSTNVLQTVRSEP
jgi:hypothetical protein